MIHKRKRIVGGCLVAGMLALSGCGGGGGSKTTPTVATSASVATDLTTTNLDSSTFPWNNIAAGKLKRWPYETSLIPVKINGASQATYALDLIETTLNKTIFDRTSIANTAENSITRGLIVSIGTAVGQDGVVDSTACGNVSSAPNSPYINGNIVDANGNISAKLYVNIGSAGCAANNTIAVHEFAHAIGLGKHFNGYGMNGITGGNFWNVLKTIYSNAVGATFANINIYTGVTEGVATSGNISPPTGVTDGAATFTADMLAGKKLQQTFSSDPATFTFNTDGTILFSNSTTNTTGTWNISQDGILTVNFNVMPADGLVYSLVKDNGTTLTVDYKHTGASAWESTSVILAFVQ